MTSPIVSAKLELPPAPVALDPEQRKEKTVIFLTRHGFREDWVNPEWKHSAMLPFDPPLAGQGIKQAKELAAALAPSKIRKIISSPYYRCIQTANEVALASAILDEQVPICLEAGVGERFNEAEAKKHGDVNSDRHSIDELLPEFSHLSQSYTSLTAQHPWHETKEQLLERGRRVSSLISDHVRREPAGATLIVTHASVLISLVRGFVGDEALRVNCAVCSITKLVWDEQRNKWKLKINGDCAHLSDGEQRPYFFGDEV